MTRASAADLLRLPVRTHGIHLGRVSDLVLDVERRRVLGFEVACGDDANRFLPLSVAEVGAHEVRIPSSLLLLSSNELTFYTSRGSTYAALRGTTVVRRRSLLGRLEDLVLEPAGEIARLVVGTEHGREQVRYDADVRLGAPGTDVLAS